MFDHFNYRSHKLERLDTGDYTPREYSLWLNDMRRINRLLGDAKVLRSTLQLESWVENVERISILDIGAGSGELLKAAKEAVGAKQTLLVGCDLSADAIRAISQRNGEFGVAALQCNGLELPFADASFDMVMCSLMLHHLSDDDAIALMREMDRVAKRLFIIIDLNRDPLAYYLFRVFSPIFLQRMTVEDGSLSILRSFRPDELHTLAARAGIPNATVERESFRLVLWSSKEQH